MKKIRLRAYSGDLGSYKETFDSNFAEIDRIQEDSIFSAFIKMLADTTGIERMIILTELKRSLMVYQEYYPEYLKVRLRNMLLVPVFVAQALKERIGYKTPEERADIIIDAWSPGTPDEFYGFELVSALKSGYKCRVYDFYRMRAINPRFLAKHFMDLVRCMAHNRQFIRHHGIDLRIFIYSFFRNFLSGLTIKKTFGAQLIISGNDNGCQTIKAKAAGMGMVLIQNGSRGLLSDSTFKYADTYISMGSESVNKIRALTGCCFKSMHSLGSIRLYNYMRSRNFADPAIKYDVLWIGSRWMPVSYKDELRNNDYLKAERDIIGMLNAYAEKYPNVAYMCRYDGEVDSLKKNGLFSDRIFYIERHRASVYEAVLQSRVILSSGSTVGQEAMGIGKKVGIINLTKSEYFTGIYRDLNIELNLKSGISFENFVEGLKARDINYGSFACQDHKYVPELLKIVSRDLNTIKG